MKSGAQFNQGTHTAVNLNAAGIRLENAAEQLQRGALPRSIWPDDADRLTPTQLK